MTFDPSVFLANLAAQPPLQLQGLVVYRYFNSALLTRGLVETPFDSAYSLSRGYRFNFPGAFPALYLAFSDLVATLEAGIRPNPLSTIFTNQEREPAILYSIRVSGRFLDLTSPSCLSALSFDPQNPEYLISTQDWESAAAAGQPAITHTIGQAVNDAGFDGLIYYSRQAWPLRSQYPPDTISALCVFMSVVDPVRPKNATSSLVLHDPDDATGKLAT